MRSNDGAILFREESNYFFFQTLEKENLLQPKKIQFKPVWTWISVMEYRKSSKDRKICIPSH